MAAKKKTKKKKVSPALIAAAEDLNEVMGLNGDDEIETDGTTTAELKKQIKNAAGLIAEGDDFEDETWELLEELGYASREEEAEEDDEDDDDEDGEEASDDDEDDDDDDDDDEEEAPPVKKKKKAPVKKKAKKVVEEEDDDEDDDDDEEEEAPAKKKKKAKRQGPSPYGMAIDTLCKNPDMSREKFYKALEKKGIAEPKKISGVNTAWSTVRKIVATLREHDNMD